MSEGKGRVFDHDHPLQAVAGVLASNVTKDLSRPLRQLRESLALMVETIERHIAEAGGPEPFPWKSLQELRQELADAYLLSRETARVASELTEAVSMATGATEAVDVNRLIEAVLELVRHRLRSDTEVFLDLGSIPPVRAIAGELMLVIAKMLLCCADSAADLEGSAVSVQTCLEHEDGRDMVLISISDNGSGLPSAADSARLALEPVLTRLSGSFEVVSVPGKGSVYECRLSVAGQ